jgi:hypothetical protein
LRGEALNSGAVKGFRTLESAAGRLHRDLSYAPVVEALRPLVGDASLVAGLSDLARQVVVVDGTTGTVQVLS